MRAQCWVLAAGLVVTAWCAGEATAQRAREVPKYDMSGQPYRGGSGRAFGQHDNAIRRPYDYDFHPNSRGSRSQRSYSRGHGHGGHQHHHSHGGFYPAPYPVYPGYGYGGYDYYGYDPLYDGYYDPPIVLPPVSVPAGSLFGPGPVQSLMGMNAVLNAHRRGRAEILEPQPDMFVPGVVIEEEVLPAPGDVRGRRDANAARIARAEHFIEVGDAEFAEQEYHAALQRYKDALTAAPTLPEVYFRQGFAQIALVRYDEAALAFKRGLKLHPDWPRSDFDLNALFGDNRAALIASRERLAEAAAEPPQDADLLFVLGVQMYFAGERERAQLFFRPARELADDDAHLDLFLLPGLLPAAQ